MKKFFSLIAASALLVGALTGCAGTPVVYYTECNCTNEVHNQTQGSAETDTVPEVVVTEGALKTGLAIVTSLADTPFIYAARKIYMREKVRVNR